MLRVTLVINALIFFSMPCFLYGKGESLSCKILELIIRDKENESIVKKTFFYRDSVDKVTGETHRIFTNVTTDTVPPQLRLRRSQILILDDFIFFETDNCSDVFVINKEAIPDSLKKKKLYVVTGISTYRDHLVITILNFSEGSKSSYFFSIKNQDIILVDRKDRSN